MTLHHAVLIYLRHLGLTCHNHYTFMCITSAHTELWAIQMLFLQAPVGVCCNSILQQAMALSIMGSIVFHETWHLHKSVQLLNFKSCTHLQLRLLGVRGVRFNRITYLM